MTFDQLTPDDVRKLEAGAECDALVATARYGQIYEGSGHEVGSRKYPHAYWDRFVGKAPGLLAEVHRLRLANAGLEWERGNLRELLGMAAKALKE